MKALPDEYENLTTLKRLSLDVELLGSFNNELLSWATTLESLEFDGGKKWEVCVSGGECIYTYCTLVYYIECARGAEDYKNLFLTPFFFYFLDHGSKIIRLSMCLSW